MNLNSEKIELLLGFFYRCINNKYKMKFVMMDDKDDVINHLKSREEDTAYCGNFIFESFNVGTHINKGSNLSKTLEELNPNVPYQIFLTARSARFYISDSEIAKCAEIVTRRNLTMFVHTPYLLNLANDDEYIVESLQNHLKVCSQMKFKGCVVHVGKSVKRPYEVALENMKNNIIKSIETATEDCPLLLETPAGQGTEMLTTCEDFVDFVLNINDPRLGICVDTCHVFASGYLPTNYVNHIIEDENKLKYLKLIHFNDSEKECTSCVDRHAYLCKGKIPMTELVNVAFIAQNYNIPLVFE